MPDVNPDELAFLAKIAEHPVYPLPRLVFADWLEERGDPRAAWVRDDDIWEWMKPDAHDPIPGILAALPAGDMLQRSDPDERIKAKAGDALWLLEPDTVDVVRQWLRAHPDHWPAIDVQQFVGTHLPSKLCSIHELKAKLNETLWIDVWLAVVDLGFHGPSAESAVTELTEIIGRRWPDSSEHVENRELPVENAVVRTLARIGSEKAVPWLASVLWQYRDSAAEALVQLKADPDLVVDHFSDEDPTDVEMGFEVVLRLAGDPVRVLVRAAQQHTGRKAYQALFLLSEMGPTASAAIPALIDLSQNRTGWDAETARSFATHALARIRDGAPKW